MPSERIVATGVSIFRPVADAVDSDIAMVAGELLAVTNAFRVVCQVLKKIDVDVIHSKTKVIIYGKCAFLSKSFPG